MKLEQRLDPYVIHKLNKMYNPSPPKEEPVVKRTAGSSLSKQDLRELMGCNRDRYHRVNGKVKRK